MQSWKVTWGGEAGKWDPSWYHFTIALDWIWYL